LLENSSASGLSSAASARHRGVLLVFLAGGLYSTSGFFTRAVHVDAWTLLAWRSLFGALFMIVMVAVENRRLSLRDYALRGPHLLLVPLTAMGTICYIFALKLTTVADVMIVYATTPFVTAAVAWLWAGEKPGRRTILASSVALVGVAVMIGGSVPSEGRLIGAALTLFMNVTFALALVLARRHPKTSMTPVNALGILLAAGVAFVCGPNEAVAPGPLLLLALFGILTIGIAVWMFMEGARLIPSAEVALIGISDTALGPLLVWVLFGENPGLAAIPGGSIVGTALIWHLWPELRGALRRQAIV
jgi:drug/metabolite transporter (DMT)-like permease